MVEQVPRGTRLDVLTGGRDGFINEALERAPISLAPMAGLQVLNELTKFDKV